jgi:hypothetical protein
MRIYALNFSLLITVVFCVGCIPYRFTMKTGAVGRVLDAQSGVPVSAAQVSTEANWSSSQHWRLTASTAQDGTFRIEPQRKWGIFILPGMGDPHMWHTMVTVSAPGYQDFTNSYRTGTPGPDVISMGDVKLAPLSQ